MTLPGLRLPPGAEVLDASGRGGTGNVTLLFRHVDPPRVLKIYRTRRSRLREAFGTFSHLVIEGKRGASAAARCETERLVIDAWTRAGFEVVRRLDLPAPAETADPCNWLEWIPGPTLQAVLRDPGVAPARKGELVRRLGERCAARHRIAIDSRNLLLLHERGHVCHVFVEGERLVFFDLENAYQATYPAARAAARELAGFARSIAALPDASALERALVAGYGDRSLFDELLQSGLRGPRADRLRRLAGLWHSPGS